MEDNKEREAIKMAYPNSRTWSGKVDKMSSAQVHAIFVKFRQEEKI